MAAMPLENVVESCGAFATDAPAGTTNRLDTLKKILRRIHSDHTRLEIEIIRKKISLLEENPAGFVGASLEEEGRLDQLLRNLKDVWKEFASQHGDHISLSTAKDCARAFQVLDHAQLVISHCSKVQQRTINDKLEEDSLRLLNTTKFICVGGESWWDQGCDDCLEGTRGAILDEIDLWTRDFTKPPIYWLDGLAGTGKSAIAETVAKRMHADGRLGASFFYSRKSNPGHTSPALAFQLAMRHTEFRLIYVPLVRLNPDVITAPPHEQMKRLVFEPLMKSLISTVIVIDALDQCEDEETVSAILSALGEFLSRTPKVKFLITSRPKPHIRKGLLPLIKSRIVTTFALHEVELHQVKSDIRRLFTEKLPELQRLWLLADGESPGPDRWPTEEHLDRLSQRAAGFFTHAVAIVNFLHNEHASPIERLNLLLESPERALLNTEICNETTLGSFYTSTLQRAFDDSKPEDDRKVRSVLGAVVLAKNALSPSTIAKLLDMDPEHVLLCLESVQSLLILQGGNDGLVRPFHESFPAFLTDQEVCTDERFYVSSPAHHMVLLIGCLELVNKGLKEIVLKRSDAAKYSRVRGGQQIDSALEYACTSWHKHLAGTIPGDNVPEIAQRLRLFLTETFPFWWREFGARGAAQLAKAAVKELNVWSERNSVDTIGLIEECLEKYPGARP